MSGIEIIGIILGAFPLAISAYEHYRGVAKTFDLLFNFEANHQKSVNDARDEELIFKLHLQQLLLPLVVDGDLTDDVLVELVSSPGGPKWKDKDVESALRKRLDQAYDRYVAILAELEIALLSLMKLLGFCGDNHDTLVARQSSNPSQYTLSCSSIRALKKVYDNELWKLKLCFQREEHQRILRDIQQKIKKLKDFLESSDNIARLHQSLNRRISPRLETSLLQYWRHADKIYALICNALKCPCSNSHCARVWLQHRELSSFEFNLLILFEPTPGSEQLQPPWYQQGLCIKKASESTAKQILISKTCLPIQPRTPVQINDKKSKSILKRYASKSVSRTGGRSVKWANANASISFDAQPIENKFKRPRGSAAEPVNPKLPARIEDLCQVMSNCGIASSCIGLLQETPDKVDGDESYSVHAQPEAKVIAEEICLSDLLGQTRDTSIANASSNGVRLTLLDRFTIALSVASSLLQLQSTSWASGQWQASDIRFFFLPDQKPPIDPKKPFVRTKFKGASLGKLPSGTYDRSFACLGILLLELFYSEKLEDHIDWQLTGFQSNQKQPLHRLMVARHWLDDIENNAPPDYSAAINWCINESPSILGGDQWRKDMYEKVVMPLEKCQAWLQPGKTTSS